jgi:hypothetical protein
MTFHYIRKNDTQATIQRANGLGMGASVRNLCRKGILPLRSNIEILRFCADILNDAMKNGFVHGDIKMDNLAVQNDGSIIINGYDRPRRSSITPEGTLSIPGDIYGLGVIMLELFSGQQNIELPLDEKLHNEKVLQIFLQINWQEWSHQPWLPTMQEYLISLLFYDPTQRPHPLDIANILKEASQTTTSFGLMEYIQRNGIRTSSQEETLEAARSLRSSALINPVEVMADSEGTATGYFTRDKIAEMFQEPIAEEQARRQEWTPEPQVQVPPPVPTPPVQPPNFATPQPPQQPKMWEQPAPPVQTPPPVVPTPPPIQQTPPEQNPWQQPRSTPSVEPVQSKPWEQPAPAQNPPWEQSAPPQVNASTPAPGWENPEPKPWEQPAPPVQTPPPTVPTPPPWSQPHQAPQERPTPSVSPASEQPTVSNPYIQSGSVTPGMAASIPEPPPPPVFNVGVGQQSPPNFQASPPPPPSGGTSLQGGIPKQWLLIGGAVLLLLIVTIIGAVWWFSKDSNQPTSNEFVKPREPIEEPAIEPSEPAQEPAEEEVEEVQEVAPPPKPTPKRRTTPKRSTTPTKSTRTPTKTTKPQKITQAAKTVGVSSFDVTIAFSGEATLQCGDGQSKDFVRQTTMTFQTRTVCRITSVNDERGALTATKSGTIQCSAAGEKIRCN